MTTTLDSSAAFLTLAQHVLRQARDQGPTKLGKRLLAEGGGMLDSHEFDALPERAQGDLGALYAEAHLRVTGALA